MDYLEAQTLDNVEQAEVYTDLGSAFQKKLWHQLTSKLMEVARMPFFLQGTHLLGLYDNFVVKVADRLNQLSLASFALAASAQKPDAAAALEFLDSVLAKVENDEQAKVFTNMCRARLLIASEKVKAKELFDAGRKAIDSYPGVMDTRVSSQLYRGLLEYYKAYGPAQEYFSSSMLYLTYTPLESIPVEQQQAMAVDVGTAALVGKNIYNFGELLQHDVIKVLQGTPKQWLVELMLAFNCGDIATYEKIMAQVQGAESVLANNVTFLNEKIRIMALMELTFKRGSDERTIPLAEVAAVCQVPENQVEMLLMRSFSLKVVRGIIDQVAASVLVSWVQPRVLDMTQIETVRSRLSEWSTQVKTTSEYLEDNARELL